MSVWFVEFGDIVTATVQYLRAGLAGVDVSTKLSDPLTLPAVQVRRIGGSEVDPTVDRPLLSVHAYDRTEMAVDALARRVRHLMLGFPHAPQPAGMQVTKVVGQGGPASVPDVDRGEPIYHVVATFTAFAHTVP